MNGAVSTLAETQFTSIVKAFRRKVRRFAETSEEDRSLSPSVGKASADRATTRRTIITLLAVGALLLAYAFLIKSQFAELEEHSTKSPLLGPLGHKLNVLFAAGFFISVFFLLRQPSYLFRSRVSPGKSLGLLSLEEFVDRMVRLRTLKGHPKHGGLLAVAAALGSVLLGFSFYIGLASIQACLLEGYPVRSAILMFVVTALPLAWFGGKVIWKANAWTDMETKAAIQRDKLPEKSDQSEGSVYGAPGSVYGAPYLMFIICFFGAMFIGSRVADEARGTCMFLASLVGFVTGGFVSYLVRTAPWGWRIWLGLVLIGAMVEVSYLNSVYSAAASVKMPLAIGLSWGAFFGLSAAAFYVRKKR